MLVEIAAANAAFQVIKGALSNGKELYDVADQATKFFDNKSAIAKKANKSGGKTGLQYFMQLEKMKEQEVWLKEYMIYAGRADMYSDWLKFQVECRQNRERVERIRVIKRANNIALFWTALLWGTGVLVILPLGLYVGFKIFGVL
jgi:hypothetical protein|tara:strand:- start:180 stop:614 length:435 start_codon:yes stop_codon:yes gene_type:complete